METSPATAVVYVQAHLLPLPPRKRVHEIHPWPLASGILAIEGKTLKRLSGPGPGDLCDEGPCYQSPPPPRMWRDSGGREREEGSET